MLNGRVCVRLNLQLFMTLKFYGVPKAPKMCIENISLTIFDIVWSSRSYLIPLTLFVRKYPSLICWPWKLWWKPCNEKIFSLIVQTIKSKNYYCITFVVRSFNNNNMKSKEIFRILDQLSELRHNVFCWQWEVFNLCHARLGVEMKLLKVS